MLLSRLSLFPRVAACASGLALASATPANAITFATGQGTDGAGCGGVTSPCRTLQQAVTNTPAGGYVVLQGPADFGPAPHINKSLSIVGEGGAIIRANNVGDGPFPVAVVGPASVVVRLRGLTIEGAGVGNTGITWLGGARLEIANCVIRNFSNEGIFVQPYLPGTSPYRSFAAVIDTVVENASTGLLVRKGYSTSIGISAFADGLRAQNNRNSGVFFSYETGDATHAVVTNSAATGNAQGVGFAAQTSWSPGPSAAASGLVVANSAASGNAAGVRSGSTISPPDQQPDGAISLSRSVITGNASANDGVKRAHSFGDNVIRGNVNDTPSEFLLLPLR